MATRLKKVRFNRVDLVDCPANQEVGGEGSHIMLYKRKGDTESYVAPEAVETRYEGQEAIEPEKTRPSGKTSQTQQERELRTQGYRNSGIDLYEETVEDVEKTKLKAKTRDALPDSDFAYIGPDGQRHLPIHDANHVRNALARLNQTGISPEAKAKAKRKIMSRARKFGIKVDKSVIQEVAKEIIVAIPEILYDNEISELSHVVGEYLGKKLGGTMPDEKVFKKEDLTTEAAKAFNELEARLAKAEEELEKAKKAKADKAKDEADDEEDDGDEDDEQKMKKFWSSAPEAIRKQYEELRKRTEEAENIAKAERDARELAEFTKRADSELAYIGGTATEKGQLLKAFSTKLTKEEFEKTFNLLKSANELVKSGKVFEEKGGSGSMGINGSSSGDKFLGMAKRYVEDKVCKNLSEAINRVAKEQPDLYNEYANETRRGVK